MIIHLGQVVNILTLVYNFKYFVQTLRLDAEAIQRVKPTQ